MTRIILLALVPLVAGCKSDPSTPEYWEGRLSEQSKKDRLKAIDDLRQSKVLTEAFAPMLHKRLGAEKSTEMKAAIARTLATTRSPTSVPVLMDAVDWGAATPEARALNKEIATTLGVLGDTQAVPTLLKLLKTKDSYTTLAAMGALARLQAPEAVEPLIEIADSDAVDPFVAKMAVEALGDLKDPRAVPTLIRAMMKDRFYREASFALYQLGRPAADALIPIVKQQKSDPMFRWVKENNLQEVGLLAKAAQVLGDLQDTRAEPALIDLLDYRSEYDDLRLIMRMRAADALGRMRSKAAVKPLGNAVAEPEPNTRHEYVVALARIGEEEAAAKLVDSASKGPWESRLESVRGLAMVGSDPRLLERVAAGEAKAIKEDCKGRDGYVPDYCESPDDAEKAHHTQIRAFAPRLQAAAACKKDVACWAGKLDDPDMGVRERAAYEVGRSGRAELIAELIKRLDEENLEARMAYIQAAAWLVNDSPQAMGEARKALPAIETQLAAEKGKTQFEGVNEELRRLHARLLRG